ncbi:hypothetical protein DLJ59_11030 [Micromonospora inaquosa]|uniref:Uncharacterized protein n=1 Tax=Micromonospora inaquosa TaxID=2203716 RepID=A0A3N9WT56_9ACTN|nr:hypothetical protein DLJ59_11030 [Micromonospora inaquosa]
MDREALDLGATEVAARDEPWNDERVRSLGMVTDAVTAGAILGVGRTKSYELARLGEFPVPVLKVGRRYIVPVPSLLAILTANDSP